jgi:hypothetical protein
MMSPQEKKENNFFSLCKKGLVIKTQNLLQKERWPSNCLDWPTSSLEKISRHLFSFLFAFKKTQIYCTFHVKMASLVNICSCLFFLLKIFAFQPWNIQFLSLINHARVFVKQDLENWSNLKLLYFASLSITRTSYHCLSKSAMYKEKKVSSKSLYWSSLFQ